MANEATIKIDPFLESIQNLIVVTFPKSTSTSYPLAVNIAQGSTYYAEATISGKVVHFAVFAKNRSDAGRAQALINYISAWKGVQIFAGGKMVQNLYTVVQVISCYLEASACTDWKAHCLQIIDDPFVEKEPSGFGLSMTIRISDEPEPQKKKVEIDQYTFPCSHLNNRFNFQRNHPSSPENQIQAGAVRQGCDWCPYLNAENYKKSGVKIVLKEVSE